MEKKSKPDAALFSREDIPEEVMGKLRAAYQDQGRSHSAACPSPETVIAFALDELPPEGRAPVQAHLLECKECLELVLDLRSARAEALEAKQEVREGEPVEVKTWDWLTELAGRLRELVSRVLSFPRLAPVAVAAPLVLLVCLGVYQHLAAPVAIHLDLVAMGADGLRTRGPLAEKEFLVPPGGVLHSGDRLRIAFETNKDAYVYVFFKNNTGKITRLFSGKVLGKKRHQLPAANDWFRLDETKGQEEVQILAAKRPLSNLEEVAGLLEKEGIAGLRKSYPQLYCHSFTFKHE